MHFFIKNAINTPLLLLPSVESVPFAASVDSVPFAHSLTLSLLPHPLGDLFTNFVVYSVISAFIIGF